MRRRPLWLTAALALISVLVVAGCNHRSAAPEKLTGVWTTSHEKYAERPFVIQKSSLLFIQGDGPDDYLLCPITSVEEKDQGEGTLYTIEYRVQEGTYSLSFYYSAKKGGRIRFKNQPEILWTIDAPTERIQRILSSNQPGAD